MDTGAFDRAITDHATALLLRYFSSVSLVTSERPTVAIERDRELLRLHWSLSSPVSALVSYALEHRHEIQTVLGSAVRFEDGVVRGRLDAMATVRMRQMSGLATAIVSHEPIRSYASGPNQVLGWVLMQAWSLASRFSTVTLDSPAYRSSIDNALQRLEQCRRIHAIAQITGQTALNQRPTAGSILEASRSRRTLYRIATDAYKALLAVEAGDPRTITAMLRETLLGPLEAWRRFELAVGFSVAEALASAENQPLSLNLLLGEARRRLAQAGRFDVYWQWPTTHYTPPKPEPSELVTRSILDSYGMSSASDRPDLVITDRIRNEVAAIVEVKYLTSEDGSDRVRSAIVQLVRYARGYTPLEKSAPLLGRSVVALSQGIDEVNIPMPYPDGTPLLTDFTGIKHGFFLPWARRLCA